MENHTWWLFTATLGIILALIGVVYKSLVSRMDELAKLSEKGMSLKVDSAEYKVVREWEKEVFSGMRMTIKELKDENNQAHEAIMLEIKRKNGIVK